MDNPVLTVRRGLYATLIGCGFLIAHLFRYQEDFYAALNYVSNEKWALMIIYSFTLAVICNLGELFVLVFIGSLRPLEFEQVQDRIVHGFLVDTVLFLVLSNPTINSTEVTTGFLMISVASTAAAKTLHLICQIRISQALELGAMAQRNLQRLFALTTILMSIDFFIFVSLFPLLSRSSTFYFWLFFESLAMISSSLVSFLKLVVYTIDSAMNGLWIWKSTLLFHLDLCNDVCSLTVYLASMLVVFIVNPSRMPFWVAAEILQFSRALYMRIRSYRRYRALSASMDRRFPHPTEDEVLEAETCIICRDTLAADTALKLPCGHILHSDCLRSWFVQQQCCPTCRFSLDPDVPEVSAAYGNEVEVAHVEVEGGPAPATAPRQTETQVPYPPIAKMAEQWGAWFSSLEGEVLDPEVRLRDIRRQTHHLAQMKSECLGRSSEAFDRFQGVGDVRWLMHATNELRRMKATIQQIGAEGESL